MVITPRTYFVLLTAAVLLAGCCSCPDCPGRTTVVTPPPGTTVVSPSPE